MLRNGQEVFDDFSLTTVQAYNVQQKINDVPEIGNDDKTDAIVHAGTIESSETNTINNANQSFSIGMFETLGGNANSKHGTRTREQLYGTYNRMGTMGLVQRALEVISDEASQKDDDNNVLNIESNNENIYDCLKTFFYEKLAINTELWPIFYETLKMGDCFYEITLEVKDGMATGIKRIKYIDPSKIEVHEKDGRLDYYIYKSQTKNNKVQLEQRLFPWQILHFKIENKETKPYGKSLLYSGIRSYERLTATEDIFLTYTISRTPNRRVFKIDVGGLPQLEAQRAIRELRDSYRSQQVIDSEGNLNQLSNILSITSDIFIPTREGQSGTSIETLQGDSMNMNQNMNFLENFKKDLISSFNVPIEYLTEGAQTGMDGKATTLSQKDIKFGRFVERIQQQVVKVLYKLATLELFFNGFKGDDLKDFTLELTPPSTIKEASELGLLTEKMNLVQTMQQLNMFPTQWLLKRILKLSDKEISEIQFMKMVEDKANEQQQMMANGGAGGGIPGIGGGVPGAENGAVELPPEIPAGNGEENPAAEAPAEGGAEGETPETLNQDVSFFNVNGQKFLLEDKNEFLKLMKFVNEQKKFKNNKESEFMSEVNSLGKKKKTNKVNPFGFLKETNEFKGLNFINNNSASLFTENDGSKTKSIGVLTE